MSDRRLHLHKLMERRFGAKANAASHSWLRRTVGECHVKDCDDRQVDQAIRAIERISVVRKCVWDKLEAERRRKGKNGH